MTQKHSIEPISSINGIITWAKVSESIVWKRLDSSLCKKGKIDKCTTTIPKDLYDFFGTSSSLSKTISIKYLGITEQAKIHPFNVNPDEKIGFNLVIQNGTKLSMVLEKIHINDLNTHLLVFEKKDATDEFIVTIEDELSLLRDLTQLREEAKIKIKLFQNEESQDVTLNPEFKYLYAASVSKAGEKIEFLTNTAKLTTKDNQYVYIPNVWFLLGIDMFDFYKELGRYKEYYSGVEEIRGLTNKDKRDEYANLLYGIYDENKYGTNPPDWETIKKEFLEAALIVFKDKIPQLTETERYKYAERLWQFSSNGYQLWVGKVVTEIANSKIEKKDESKKEKKTRKVSRKDFRDSVVLALLDLVAADQGYVPDIMTVYENEEKSFQRFLADKQLITGMWHITKGNSMPLSGGANLIVYGTPGCGKSTYVNNILNNDVDPIRTTFYQDYTYTDFVGQILPKISQDGAVSYSFNPGPFTQALELALTNPNKKIALVIEELNRGNAPSIFGDIFQLLDRYNDDNQNDGGEKHIEGEGKFTIRNRSIAEYLKTKGLELDDIWLPANLSIYATMNTSDQNVFTLDTAFKRRWDFIKLRNEFPTKEDIEKDPKKKHPFATDTIKNMPGVTWQIFVETLNDYIVNCKDLFKSEDKLLGIYFISDKKTLNDNEAFAYKVFEYLWDDVFRNNHEYLINANIKTLDGLVNTYIKGNDGTCVFCKEFRDLLNRNINASKETSDVGNKEKGASSTPTQHDSE